MSDPRDDKDEAKLEQLAKKLLRTKPKPRQEYEVKGKTASKPNRKKKPAK